MMRLLACRSRRLKGQRGLTFVETMASLALFSMMTIGITPVLVTSVRGAGLSRSYTVGKNLAQQEMERIRGLPYFVSVTTQNEKVDVLDLYFPSLGAGYDAADHSFTTTCTSVTSASKACPAGLPEGFSVTYVASFVDPAGGTSGDPEEYVVQAPQAGYAWNSVNNDLPPSRLLKMDIEVSWSFGSDRSYKLTSLVGDRKVGEDRIAGEAKVDYTVQVLTSFEKDGLFSDLRLEMGHADGEIRSRLLSEADVDVSGGSALLTRPAPDASTDAEELAAFTGAATRLHAPPDVTLAAGDTQVAQTIQHPHLADAHVAGVSDTFTKTPLVARVADELPAAAGSFSTNNSASTFDGWVNVQASLGSDTALKLNASQPGSSSSPSRPMLHLKKNNSVSSNGSVAAATGAVGQADRRVETTAAGAFGRLSLFPVTFIDDENPADRTVIRIENFVSQTRCNSTANPSTATATASYDATLKYWKELDPNDGVATGAYQSVSLSGTNASDPLAAIDASEANNPMVWEDPLLDLGDGSANDIYLFPIHHDHGLVEHDHPGYLNPDSGWASLFNLGGTEVDGRVTEARIPGAVQITTVPLDESIPESSLNITVGSLSCKASDFR